MSALRKKRSKSSPKIRAMKLTNGSYSKSESYVIGRIVLNARFINSPNGYFYTSLNDAATGTDVVRRLYHGQTTSTWKDPTVNQVGSNTAYTFDNKWHEYDIYSNVASANDIIEEDSVVVHTTTISNFMVQAAFAYNHGILSSGVDAEFKRIRVYDLNGALKYDWNFETGDAVPTGWSNAEIIYAVDG